MTPGPDLEPPAIRLEQVEDLTPPQPPGFLRLVRPRWVAHYPDGSVSQPFVYDEVDRAALDAVVIAAHFSEGGRHHVYLRSAVRPPVARREAPGQPHGLWELPAGLVEPSEAGTDGQVSGRRPSAGLPDRQVSGRRPSAGPPDRQVSGRRPSAGLPDRQVSGRRPSAGPPDGARRTAQRELEEELGFTLPLEQLLPLGHWLLPAPGIIAERHYYFAVLVEPSTRVEPSLDGSPLEHFGKVVAVELDAGLALCRSGEICDAKTELGLRRLKERLG